MTQDLQWDAARGSNASPTPRTSKSTTTFTRLAQTSQGNITVQNTTGLGIHETARYKGVIERPQPSLAPVPGVDVSAPAPAVLTLGETYSPAIGNDFALLEIFEFPLLISGNSKISLLERPRSLPRISARAKFPSANSC